MTDELIRDDEDDDDDDDVNHVRRRAPINLGDNMWSRQLFHDISCDTQQSLWYSIETTAFWYTYFIQLCFGHRQLSESAAYSVKACEPMCMYTYIQVLSQ